MSEPLFLPGQVVFTPGALDFMDKNDVNFMNLLLRHLTGDWGDLDAADKKENDFSVLNGYRILSSYNVDGGKVWIITEADRSATTFLLPDEY
jgi:hypothetical protein